VGDAAVEGPFNIPLSDIVDGQNFIAVKIFQRLWAALTLPSVTRSPRSWTRSRAVDLVHNWR